MPDILTLSLIVPAYDEVEGAGEIIDFYREIRGAHPALHIELLVVDDGSTDGTPEAVMAATVRGDDVRVVQLSRNFGAHAAISAGLAHCTGDAALTLSADRQEPLEAVGDFVDAWQAGADIVWGLRSVRASKGGLNEVFARTFSTVFHAVSIVPTYPSEGPSHILVTRKVIDVLNAMPEGHRNVLAMAAWTGFDQRRIYFAQMPRPHGTSRWTSAKKVKLVIDSIVEFSSAPVRWIQLAGAALSALGAVLLVGSAVQALLAGGADGFRLAICGLVLAVGGAQLMALGIVGEYVWRAGDDARRRPLSIVRAVHRTGTRG
ncbi:MAG: glycosyltransferase [Cellulomonas sp.]